MKPQFKAWVTEPVDKTSDRYANIDFPCMVDVLTLNMYEDGCEVEGFLEDDSDTFVRAWEDGFTLRRFSGLPDKTGDEIYEGDIVQIDSDLPPDFFGGEVHQVKFMRGTFFANKDCHTLSSFAVLADVDGRYLRATKMGNIYKNPDLLKNSEDDALELKNSDYG